MKISIVAARSFNYLLFLCSFCLPLFPSVLPVLIILITLSWFLLSSFEEKLGRLNQNKFYLLFSSIYILYLIGLCYSENLTYGYKDVELKLSLLLFPLIFGSIPLLEKQIFQSVFKGFILGCAIALILCLFYALYYYSVELYHISNNVKTDHIGIYWFLFGKFSLFLHPSYFSMYLCLALLMILYFY